ncbi:MAG: LVIVD repeat-containing protein, partial [Nitrospinota bacterium]
MTRNPVGVSRNVRLVGRTDLPGGGQVVVQDGVAYVGHMDPPDGTTLLDVSDPRRPRVLSRIQVPPDTHSHKVRVRDGVMVVNREARGKDRSGFRGGVKVFDVSDPRAPREIAFFPVPASGVHRFDLDE